MEFFDSHAHYNDEKFEERRDLLLKVIYDFGVTKIVNAGYSLESSKRALEIAEKHEFMYTTAGISPNDIDDFKEEDLLEIEKLARNKKCVAIGEIGLDYYWNQGNKELQKKVFKLQIQMANKLELPIVIHTRDAIYDTLEILKNNECKLKGVFHCCPLNVDIVREGLKLGYYISFAGPCTFKNSKNADEIIKMVPEDRMLIETDSPYLSPEPLRGRRNDSRNLQYIVEKIAKVKEKDTEEIAKITYENANRIFKR